MPGGPWNSFVQWLDRQGIVRLEIEHHTNPPEFTVIAFRTNKTKVSVGNSDLEACFSRLDAIVNADDRH